MKILQTNLNHARHAQELLFQSIAELEVGLAIVAEPYQVPQGDRHWLAATDDSVACHWRYAGGDVSAPFSLAEAGVGYVAVKWDDCLVVGAYLPPRLNVREFEERLDSIAECIRRYLPAPVILAGDFNAKSALWGSAITNAKGNTMEEWANAVGLCCLNVGNRSTCIRAQGESIIDTSWATPIAARRIANWMVRSDMETLSDHMYITMDVMLRRRADNEEEATAAEERINPRFRWSLAKLDADKLCASLLASSWPVDNEEVDVEEKAFRLREEIRDACDFAMPRNVPRPLKAVYWWTEHIAELRTAALRRRREWRQGRDTPDEEFLRGEYRQAKYALCHAINGAKNNSWDELLRTLDRDPWGRPYKIVRKKLKRWSLSITETLDRDFLGVVTNALFPQPDVGEQTAMERDQAEEGWNAELEIGELELTEAVRKMRSRNVAPGPDGPGEDASDSVWGHRK